MNLRQPDRFDLGVIAVAVTAGVWRLFTTAHWSWFNDDWTYLADVESRGLVEYLFQDYSSHLMPGGFLMTWIITKLFPLEFWAAVLVTGLMAFFATLVWGQAFRVIFGPRMRVLVPLSLMVLSPTLIRPTMWWASATQVLPLQLTTGLCCLAMATHLRSPSHRSGRFVLVAFVLGLFFWQKALLALLPIGALLLLAEGGSVRAVLTRHARLLLSLGGACAVYLVAYWLLVRVGSTGSAVAQGDSPSVLEFWWATLRNLVAPSLWGGPWGTLPLRSNFLTAPSPTVAWTVFALLLLAVALACWLRRRAWIPLLLVAAYFLVAATLIYLTFATTRNSGAAWLTSRDDRYVADTLTVAFLAMALLITPTLLERPGPAFRAVPRALRPAGMGLAAVLLASLLVGNVLAWQRIAPHPGREWLATVKAEARSTDGVGVVDGRPPHHVLEWEFWPATGWTSRMLAPLRDLNLGGPAQSLVRISEDGHFREQPVGEAVTARPGPVTGCGYAVDDQTQAIPLTGDPLFPLVWGISVETVAGADSEVLLRVTGTVEGREVQRTHVLPVRMGVHRLQMEHSGPVEVITVRTSRGQPTVCLAALRVGDLSD